MTENLAALSYHEPDIFTILVLSSFVLLSNVINYALDRIVYCGLVGQILIGVAYGVPGADWLSRAAQDFVMQFGYLGLILIVYEGGLSTNLQALRANLALSSLVASIGISMPIALSFILQELLKISPLQAFAAGAALCSTSLGTTFTVLSTSGLTESRLGIILTSAAMMDDVVGLVMVQVISNLGQSSKFRPATVLRPVGVSLAFACLLPLACKYMVRPLAKWIRRIFVTQDSRLANLLAISRAKFLWQTLILLGMLTGANYAGASALFAAYLAGVCIVWWDGVKLDDAKKSAASPASQSQSTIPQNIDVGSGVISESSKIEQSTSSPVEKSNLTSPAATQPDPAICPSVSTETNTNGLAIYEQYYKTPVESILKPFFFTSIGFSIPITKMFAGGVVWRGFIYAALMILAKLLCGICLIRFSVPSFRPSIRAKKLLARLKTCWPFPATSQSSEAPTRSSQSKPARATHPETNQSASKSRSKKPLSLYPSAILGSAMVARGEIGFLISSVAESNGIFNTADQTSGQSGSELFLVVTWAILICTILGPVAVGLLVRRVKRLQDTERQTKSGREDPLGVWGITASNEITTQ